MTEPTTLKGGALRVLLGNGASPQVYSAPCGFLRRALSYSKTLEDARAIGCSDADILGWVGRDATGLALSISGEGVLAAESVERWLEAVEDDDETPIKIELSLGADTITWTGFAEISAFEVTAEDGRRVLASVTLESDGTVTREQGGGLPRPPAGYVFTVKPDGTYWTNSAGALYLKAVA